MYKVSILFIFFLVIFSLYGCSENEVILRFDSTGGNSITDIKLSENETLKSLPTPVKDGYNFEGWYIDDDYVTLFSIQDEILEKDITLYAKWSRVIETGTISFDTNGGSIVDQMIYPPGTSITSPTPPTKEGYVFSSWYESIDSIEPYEFDTMPSTNLILYADWATEGLFYELIDDTYYEVSAGDACSTASISIPKYYEGKPVQSIANQGFMSCGEIIEIILPRTLQKINDRAFMETSIESIEIPSSVDHFGVAVFRFTRSLESITVDSNNTNFKSEDGVLFSKDGLTLVRYPSAKLDTIYTINNHVTTIGSDAFSSSYNLISIMIGNSVKIIKDHAFFDCLGLTTIDIVDNVETIELYAFRSNINLATVHIGSGITAISAYMFYDCRSLTSIVIPYQVLSIGYGAFYDCSRLTTVHLKRSSMHSLTTGALFMFMNTPTQMKIYVEDTMSVDAYKQAIHWGSYQSRIELKP